MGIDLDPNGDVVLVQNPEHVEEHDDHLLLS